jgi:hypothetical protein
MTTTESDRDSAYSGDFPEAWIFDEHGETIAGRFVRFDRGHTRNFGQRAICVLLVEGFERALWLSQTALLGKFRDEVRGRPGYELTLGERIVVTRLEKVMAADGKTEYWGFRVLFPDRPQLSTADLLGLSEERESVGPSDDVPF